MRGSGVSGPSFDAVMRNRLDRSYCEAAPTITRNTLVPATTLAFDKPGYFMTNAGPVINANGVLIGAFERNVNDVFLEGPDSADPQEYPLSISAHIWSSCSSVLVGDDASIGIQWYSANTNTPWSLNFSLAQLRQRFNDPTTFELYTQKGDGTAGELTVITGIQSDGPGAGHRFELLTNPRAETVTALIGNRVVAKHGPASYPDINVEIASESPNFTGFFVKVGAAAFNAAIGMEISGFRATSYGTAGGKP